MSTEYRTPSGRLAPYPDMSDEELDDFEHWAQQVDREYEERWVEIRDELLLPLSIIAVLVGLASLFL